MTFKRKQNQAKAGEKISNLFSILAYDHENGIFLGDDQSLSFGFLCTPLSGADSTVSNRVNVFLNQEWPTDTLVQVCLWTSPDIDPFLAAMQARRLKQTKPMYRELVTSTVDFLRNGAQGRNHSSETKLRYCHLIITVKIQIAGAVPSNAELESVSRLCKETHQSLDTIGLQPRVFGADDYVRMMSTILNWNVDAGWHDQVVPECDPNQLIRDQLVDYNNSIRRDSSGLWFGDKRVKTLSVKRFPDRLFFGSAMSYLGDIMSGTRGIKQNMMLTVTIHYPDVEKTKSAMETKRQWVVNQAYGPLLKFLPQLAVRKQGFDTLNEAFQDGDRPIKTYLGAVLFCDKEEEAQAVSNARVYFRELGFQLMDDRYFCTTFFLNCMPLGADRLAISDSNRYRTMATRHVIPLLPLFADWAGTGTPTLNFFSRTGQLMNVSLFDSGSNYNCCIAAQSGSGKSFLTNEIITNYLTEGARIWVIDVGRSYQNLAETLDGDFMEFNPEKQICLNPFELIRHWTEEADVVAGLVTAMAAPTEK